MKTLLAPDCLIIIVECLCEFVLLEQRDAKIIQRAWIVGIDLECAAAGGNRLIDAAARRYISPRFE